MRGRGTYDIIIDNFAAGESAVYGINWLKWLQGSQIVASEVEVEPSGELTATPTEDVATVQRFRLADGVANKNYSLVATITTDNGDTLKASILVVVKEP